MVQGEGLDENLKINKERIKAKQKVLRSTGER